MTKFETTGSVLKMKSPNWKRSCRTEEHCDHCEHCDRCDHCEFRKINSPTLAAVGYPDRFIVSNFTQSSPYARVQNSTEMELSKLIMGGDLLTGFRETCSGQQFCETNHFQ